MQISAQPNETSNQGNSGITQKNQGKGINREEMIAVAAYYRAEHRDFDGGDSVEDWLAAEAEIDALLRHVGEPRSNEQ
ncbi:MAG: DUF2934 domain-containing protein [Betaproteobacteria bacterium]|nr:DUF2934 domain-containing protein [Betaproteobacteria bacterium]